MATTKLWIIFLTYIAAVSALPSLPEPVLSRNTIAFEETLEGQVFEAVDAFQDITLFNNNSVNPYRLPTTTRPLSYQILWSTDFDALAFAGSVSINLTATEAGVNEIVIHSEDLTIISATLTYNGNIIPISIVSEEAYLFLRIQLATGTLNYNAANPNLHIYTLNINFEAEMREDMYGIYKTWYRHDNETRWMASTQFQATSARKAFPCYDEPSFKAYFDITIRRPTNYTSWSCTRISSTTPSVIAGYEEDVFHTTPYMSTYLIAIIVSEYSSLQTYNNNNEIIYEVIARPNAMDEDQGRYAFDVGQLLLAEMSDHTGIDFYSVDPNIKMTQAAIPDFSAGAMENWGLLTYREAYLMYDENHTSDSYKQIIAYILSHEIAHMWFGNLVTCDWWDVLWLNEGFARYYQYFLTDAVEDYMGFETRFIIEQVHTSLLTDASAGAFPLTNPGVGSPAAVSAMFGSLTYNKGAAIIRMTEHLLGYEVHREGLRNYLANFAFDVALPINLFDSLQNVSVLAGAIEEYGPDFTIENYYRTWTEQPGAPVLNVQVNHQTGDMTIQQRLFNINTGYATANTLWWVPISFASASNPDFNNTKPTHILRDAVAVINRGSVGDEWVVFNKQQTGFYRVNYDDYTWDLIVMALRSASRTQIHEYNRAQIVNDVFQFARSGLMSYTRAFNILSFLEFETEYAPWVAAVTGFNWIRLRLIGTPLLASLEQIIVRWATPVMTQLGYTAPANETFMRSFLRFQLAPLMCNVGVEACRTAAAQQYQNLVNNGIEVDPNSRTWVYCNGLRSGTEADFDFLWERFQNHNVYTEKILILQSIGCTPHAASLNTLMDGIVQENELVRPQDYTTAFNVAVTGNEGNTQIAFQYIQNNMQNVTNAFGSIVTPLSYVSARLRSEAEIAEFQTWATQNQAILGNSYQSVMNGVANSRFNLEFATDVSDDLNQYVTEGDQPVSVTTTQATTTPAPVTVPLPPLDPPVAPDLPDSAVTSLLSLSAILFAVALNMLF